MKKLFDGHFLKKPLIQLLQRTPCICLPGAFKLLSPPLVLSVRIVYAYYNSLLD